MILSDDALIFGMGYLRGPKHKLSFGGEGAEMAITDRARAALDELIAAGYAEKAPSDCQIKGREYYCGTDVDPHIGQVAKDAGLDLFDEAHAWATFVEA